MFWKVPLQRLVLSKGLGTLPAEPAATNLSVAAVLVSTVYFFIHDVKAIVHLRLTWTVMALLYVSMLTLMALLYVSMLTVMSHKFQFHSFWFLLTGTVTGTLNFQAGSWSWSYLVLCGTLWFWFISSPSDSMWSECFHLWFNWMLHYQFLVCWLDDDNGRCSHVATMGHVVSPNMWRK